jgi:hypothetical protein
MTWCWLLRHKWERVFSDPMIASSRQVCVRCWETRRQA